MGLKTFLGRERRAAGFQKEIFFGNISLDSFK
jgi:hypothetical protein